MELPSPGRAELPFPAAAIMPSAGMHFQLPIVFALLAQEALMGDSTRSGRRQVLNHTAALAGVAGRPPAAAGRAPRQPASQTRNHPHNAPPPPASPCPTGP